jgi:DUF971 family protein
MSIWNYMKPSQAAAEPVGISMEGRTLKVDWGQGTVQILPFRLLRQQCPCAACVDEWTHQRTLDAQSVPEDIALREAKPVGNYALQLNFSDGHQTGIYAWSTLRELGDKLQPAK